MLRTYSLCLRTVSHWYSRRIAQWVLFSPLAESRRRKTAHVNATAPRCSRFSPEVAAGARLTCKMLRAHWLPRNRGRAGSDITITCRPVVAPLSPSPPSWFVTRQVHSSLCFLPPPPLPPHPPQVAPFLGGNRGKKKKKDGENIYWRVKKK